MDYKSTVFLPTTAFSMKANLAQREPEFLERWKKVNIYNALREKSAGKRKFILHYGPPYANGHIHIGHALTKILKDVVNKSHQMLGFDAPMVPGWDCHGLPIEWKIEEKYRDSGKNKDEVDVLEFRDECRKFATKWLTIQKEEFQRLGVIADWENPYSTMTFENEANIVEQLGHFLMNGSLYRGLRPVLWSVVEKTALAEAEVEYQDHTSDSVYVAFPIQNATEKLCENVEALIWTTTPWTLPANRAICYSPTLSYAVVELSNKRRLLLAQDLLESVMKTMGADSYKVLQIVKGIDLKGLICAHPLAGQGYDYPVPLLPGEHVTADAGTGLVHTAPSHGQEDFIVGKEFGLEVPETVGPDGRYHEDLPLFAGLHIFKANAAVIEALKDRDRLLYATKIIHSYPHSWRSKAPLIYRATAQWFISMEKNDLRNKALRAIEETKWWPTQGRNRIHAMVESRPDWCISRQRAWGTPLALFVHKRTGEVLRDEEVHARIVEAVRQEGGDVWYSADSSRFLGPDYDPADYEKIMDVLDVWFDSGCTHFFVLKNRPELSWPADLYLEGSDQHRGWFQSSLMASCGITGRAPYKNVLTHGFVVDEKGYKMSKSQGTGVAPEEIMKTLGADILRLWVMSIDSSEDMRIGKEILKQQEDIYRRFRNTLRYLLGALNGYDATQGAVDYNALPALEKWVLHRLSQLDIFLRQCIDKFEMMEFYSTLHDFCVTDLSAFYFDIRKDCLYCDGEKSPKRQATLFVMDKIFNCLCLWLAPTLSFTAEEAWLTRLGDHATDRDSVHLQEFPEIPEKWKVSEAAIQWGVVRDMRRVITGALEVERSARTIGSSLQAEVAVYVSSDVASTLRALGLANDLAELAITSEAELIVAQPPAGAFVLEDVESVGVVVNQAVGEKCQRCWKVLPEVAEIPEKICKRCCEAVQ